jgi:hypothetical protein
VGNLNFYIVPVFHIYNGQCIEKNMRIIKLVHISSGKIKYVMWNSTVFSNLKRFKACLAKEGNYQFIGNKEEFRKMWRKIAYNFTFFEGTEDIYEFMNNICSASESSQVEREGGAL